MDSYEAARGVYDDLIRLLRRHGFSVRPDEHVKKNYPSLSETHRVGRYRGEHLEFSLESNGIHTEITFFQELVKENPNGGKYDFNKFSKMPFLVRLRFQWIREKIREFLEGRGLPLQSKVESPIPDPLAWFNDGWSSNRFDRGEDGWPSDKVLKSWSRKDANGEIIGHGDVVHFRDHSGHPVRGLAYGGINGMWTVVYGPGVRDYAQEPACYLSRKPLPKGRWFRPDVRRSRIQRKLDKAVESMCFERAIGMRDALKRIDSVSSPK
jgi:hypothetical protein